MKDLTAIDLLVRAYDMMEDLGDDGDHEDADVELNTWLRETAAWIKQATGREVSALVSEMLDAQFPSRRRQ